MLQTLAIRDIVLIERLEIAFSDGLTVLTGETGAGKSILLDALSLALGGRGDAGLVRHGADLADRPLAGGGLESPVNSIVRRVRFVGAEAAVEAGAQADGRDWLR